MVSYSMGKGSGAGILEEEWQLPTVLGVAVVLGGHVVQWIGSTF